MGWSQWGETGERERSQPLWYDVMTWHTVFWHIYFWTYPVYPKYFIGKTSLYIGADATNLHFSPALESSFICYSQSIAALKVLRLISCAWRLRHVHGWWSDPEKAYDRASKVVPDDTGSWNPSVSFVSAYTTFISCDLRSTGVTGTISRNGSITWSASQATLHQYDFVIFCEHLWTKFVCLTVPSPLAPSLCFQTSSPIVAQQ